MAASLKIVKVTDSGTSAKKMKIARSFPPNFHSTGRHLMITRIPDFDHFSTVETIFFPPQLLITLSYLDPISQITGYRMKIRGI